MIRECLINGGNIYYTPQVIGGTYILEGLASTDNDQFVYFKATLKRGGSDYDERGQQMMWIIRNIKGLVYDVSSN